jgi:hypothetical protein
MLPNKHKMLLTEEESYLPGSTKLIMYSICNVSFQIPVAGLGVRSRDFPGLWVGQAVSGERSTVEGRDGQRRTP